LERPAHFIAKDKELELPRAGERAATNIRMIQ
jgi:hypothetical protein